MPPDSTGARIRRIAPFLVLSLLELGYLHISIVEQAAENACAAAIFSLPPLAREGARRAEGGDCRHADDIESTKESLPRRHFPTARPIFQNRVLDREDKTARAEEGVLASDLAACDKRKRERSVSFGGFVQSMKRRGLI